MQEHHSLGMDFPRRQIQIYVPPSALTPAEVRNLNPLLRKSRLLPSCSALLVLHHPIQTNIIYWFSCAVVNSPFVSTGVRTLLKNKCELKSKCVKVPSDDSVAGVRTKRTIILRRRASRKRCDLHCLDRGTNGNHIHSPKCRNFLHHYFHLGASVCQCPLHCGKHTNPLFHR